MVVFEGPSFSFHLHLMFVEGSLRLQAVRLQHRTGTLMVLGSSTTQKPPMQQLPSWEHRLPKPFYRAVCLGASPRLQGLCWEGSGGSEPVRATSLNNLSRLRRRRKSRGDFHDLRSRKGLTWRQRAPGRELPQKGCPESKDSGRLDLKLKARSEGLLTGSFNVKAVSEPLAQRGFV